jgi:hypothetical protein
MLGDILRNEIIRDNEDATATDVRMANVGIFTDDVEVPRHAYLSTKTLLLGAAASADEYSDAISKIFGLNDTPDDKSINIAIDSMESSEDPGGALLDSVGAESAIVRILVRLHTPIRANDANTVEEIHLRLRSILDWQVRGQVGRKPAIPITGDPTFDITAQLPTRTFPFICRWVRFGGVENSIERVSFFRCTYIRTFFRAS